MAAAIASSLQLTSVKCAKSCHGGAAPTVSALPALRVGRAQCYNNNGIGCSSSSRLSSAVASSSLAASLTMHRRSPGLHNLCARRKPLTRSPARHPAVTTGAASDSAPVPAGESGLSTEFTEKATLAAFFGAWYAFNIFFNIYNKQVLKVYPYPLTCTLLQFFVGSLVALSLWVTNLLPRPKAITKEQLIAILPLAIVHTLGNALTNVSLGKVAVSFTHTIKAMEPFFSVLLSALFLGEKPQLPVILSLLPIVFGVGMASVSEVSFNWAGFLSAMGSNVTFQSRNVLSKKLMIKKDEGALDNINLFSVMTMMAFVLMLPVAFLLEGVNSPAAVAAAKGADVNLLISRALGAAFCFHAYQQVSYMILQRVSPVTHSVGNCVKRVVVIVSSVIFFRTPVSPLNAAGTATALAGVFLYSQLKSKKGAKAA